MHNWYNLPLQAHSVHDQAYEAAAYWLKQLQPQSVYHYPFPPYQGPPPFPSPWVTSVQPNWLQALLTCPPAPSEPGTIPALLHVKLGIDKHGDNVQDEQVHGLDRISFARQMSCSEQACRCLMPGNKLHLYLQVRLQMLQLMMRMIA